MIEEDEREPEYQMNVYDRILNNFVDYCYFFSTEEYEDNSEEEASKIFQKEFGDKYPLDKYGYEIEYIGSLRSDAGYNMSVDRNIYTE